MCTQMLLSLMLILIMIAIGNNHKIESLGRSMMRLKMDFWGRFVLPCKQTFCSPESHLSHSESGSWCIVYDTVLIFSSYGSISTRATRTQAVGEKVSVLSLTCHCSNFCDGGCCYSHLCTWAVSSCSWEGQRFYRQLTSYLRIIFELIPSYQDFVSVLHCLDC